MAIGIRRPLEPIGDIVNMREPSRLSGLRGRQTTHPAAAYKIDVVLGHESRFAQLLLEIGIALHRRVYLPGDQHRLLPRGRQIRDTHEIPFGIRADVNELCLRIAL